MLIRWLGLFLFITFVAASSGAQPQADNVRRIPPAGIEVPAADRAELDAGVAELGKEIEQLREALKARPAQLALLPDVQVYHNAVRYALAYNEFFKPEEIKAAKSHLKLGLERARSLRDGKAPWTMQTDLVVRGYLSEIDGSVQPYGLVVPATYQSNLPFQHRLDAWFHGRNETLSEANFITDRQKNPGQFTPAGAFVLHLYGRYCNANKFAGEMDLFEVLAHVRKHYPIDENRISVRGFSMGGAATWHIAAHHAGLWAAAAPGAGFAETPEYLKLTPGEVPWYERKLWHLYDATDYAVNLFNCPTVAYSGELDRQKQAADVMARNLKAEGIDLTHIIGPKTEHKYHPDSIAEINRRMDSIVARGRNPVPRQLKLTTGTLRYNRMLWLRIDAIEQHWERARVDAEIRDAFTVQVKTQNVSALTLEMPAGQCPLDNTRRPVVVLDEQKIEAAPVMSDRRVGEQTYSAGHAPVMIYPNPLNPKRYVVINSGFTFREAAYLTNARQVPRLPDWAVIDLSVPPGPRAPGKIVNAGFFGERWELK